MSLGSIRNSVGNSTAGALRTNMSAEEWDSESFEPPLAVGPTVQGNKWEGEDEDDEVKDSWDQEDEEEEKKDVEKQLPSGEPQIKAIQVKKSKKSLSEKIQKREEEEAERQKLKEMTPEEKLAEKIRVQKLQEEADLQAAKEVFGVTGLDSINTGLDVMNPSTKEEFEAFQKALSDKVTHYSKLPTYPAFVENLVRNICVPLNPLQLKRIKSTVETLAFEKSKAEKATQSKKTKGKVRAQLKLDDKDLLVDDLSAYGATEFDDFM